MSLIRARLVARVAYSPLARSVAKGSTRRLCDVASKPSGFSQLLRDGQVDSGMWQGAALLGGVVLGVQLASPEQKSAAVSALLGGFRSCGLTEDITNRQLIKDYVAKNAAAACNVLMASPVFYFVFAKIHGESLAVCTVRSISGTLRIVPFMGFFYGFFGVVGPFVTAAFMQRGQSYEDAQSSAGTAVMLSGLVFIEAIVELRGCGVTFAQMTASSFILFIPALVGRLAAGVLTQQQKTGTESEPLLPASWQEGPTWQQHTYMTFEMLHIDKEFFITTGGTTVFQHILNGITWVLLTRGKSATLPDILRFIGGGMQGTPLSGAMQLGKTFVMRFGFGWAWNWCSSQQLDMPVFDEFIQEQ